MELLERLNKGKFILPIMKKIAEKYDVPFTVNNTYSGKCAIIGFPHSNFVIWDAPFNINYSGSIKICKNKDICTAFLQRNGFKVPNSENFTRRTKEKNEALYEPMMDFIQKTGNNGFEFPLIIKPATLSQGIGICKINNVEEAKDALNETLKNDSRTFIIQEFCKGRDYRVVVLNDKVIQAYERVPFHVIGDGVTPIEELIKNKIQFFIEEDRDKKVNINDPRILKCIKDSGYSLKDILEKGKILKLQNISNLSLGGNSVDYTDSISSYFKDVAINVAKTLNLDMCGIDIITSDISDEKNRDYRILEVNSAPGLDNYLYQDKEEQERYVEYLYEQIFLYLMKKDELLYNKNNQTKNEKIIKR